MTRYRELIVRKVNPDPVIDFWHGGAEMRGTVRAPDNGFINRISKLGNYCVINFLNIIYLAR